MRVAVLNRTVNLAAAATLIFNLHDGARQGAPQAIQVADRWHLLANMREAVERVLTREQASVRAAAAVLRPAREVEGAGPTAGHETDEFASAPSGEGRPAAVAPRRTRPEEEQCVRRVRRQARYEEVMVLHRQGLGQRAIARALGVGRHTIRTFLRTGAFPARRARTTSGTILVLNAQTGVVLHVGTTHLAVYTVAVARRGHHIFVGGADGVGVVAVLDAQ